MNRGLLIIGLLAAVALGSEADGGHAGIERWMHARGPASNSGRTLAWAPDSFGGVAWTYRAQTAVTAPPVTWDGVGFVLDGSALVALDLVDGRLVARTSTTQADPATLCVHNRAAFVIEETSKLVQYRLKGRGLARRWSHDVGANAFPPRILGGEIYVATPEHLVRLRAGASGPTWRAEARFAGAPAVFGNHVYAVQRHENGRLVLHAYQRSDGAEVAAAPVADDVKPGALSHVVVSKGIVAVKVPYTDDWVLSQRKVERDTPQYEFNRTETFRGAPLVSDSSVMGRTIKPDAWTIFRFGKQPRVPIVTRKRRPELIAGAQDCVSLNGNLCFGTWATDLSSNRILWHLQERKDVTTFADGVRFHVVPAGHHRLLLVTADGKALHLMEQEKF